MMTFAQKGSNTVKYLMGFKTILLALLITPFIIPTVSFAQCGSPNTCITMNMIGTGQNALVDIATPLTKIKEITGKDTPTATTTNCALSPRIKTGVTVYRYYAPTKTPEYRKYDDQFCLSQGCNFQGGLMGSPECTENAP